jgi:hypothetical protein
MVTALEEAAHAEREPDLRRILMATTYRKLW